METRWEEGLVATSRPGGRAAVSVMGRVALMHTGLGQQEALNPPSLESRSDHGVSGWEQAWSPPLLEAQALSSSNQDFGVVGVFLGQNHPIPPHCKPLPCPPPASCLQKNFGRPGLLEFQRVNLIRRVGNCRKQSSKTK